MSGVLPTEIISLTHYQMTKFSKLVENTVRKGEIACYEQFLLFPVFSKGFVPKGVKRCHCVAMG